MYQTVMILLVTAVVTIITTIVTVRVTMTGRVISQPAKDKLTSSAKRYGSAVFIVIFAGHALYNLVTELRSPAPVTRASVFLIALWTIFVFIWTAGLIITLALRMLPWYLLRRIEKS